MPEKKLNLNFATVFTAAGDVSNVQYEISFISETPSLGLESYFIRQLKVILVSYLYKNKDDYVQKMHADHMICYIHDLWGFAMQWTLITLN